jgi:cysteine desulfuration protein SufE
MNATPSCPGLAGLERTLRRLQSLPPELVRQALVQYSRKLAPLPEHLRTLPREPFAVHECQTPVALYPEVVDGRLVFWADVPASAPSIRALLAVLFEAFNGCPPEEIEGIPSDFVRRLMDRLGLGAREAGLNAIVERLRRAARQARQGAGLAPGAGAAPN